MNFSLFRDIKFPIIFIFITGILIYSNSLTGSFNFDDFALIVNNQAIRNISDIKAIWDFYPSRFVTFFTFALNYHFFRLNVFSYHIFNLAIHIASALMVFWLILLTFSTPTLKNEQISRHSRFLALFSSLIFLSHPLQTESVDYIWQRCTSLSGLFYLLSLCLYLKARLAQIEVRPRFRYLTYYIFFWIFVALAMFSKENTVTVIFIIILYEIYFFKRKKFSPLIYFAPFFLLLSVLILTLLFKHSPASREINLLIHQRTNSVEYLLTQSRVVLTYLRLLFLPLNQNIDYYYPLSKSLWGLPTLAGFMFSAVIIISALKYSSKYRLFSFSVFWFFFTLLLESSVIPLEDVIFEHRLYLPMVGFSLFMVSLVYYLFKDKKAQVFILSLVVVSFSAMTYQRNKVWQNELTLWNDVVRKSPEKERPFLNRGRTYELQGKLDLAFSDYNRAIANNPKYAAGYFNRGNIYRLKGDLGRAVSDYNEAIALDPSFSIAYYNRGNIYLSQGNYRLALSDYNVAIGAGFKKSMVYYQRGIAYKKMGEAAEAISDFSKAIELDPDFSAAGSELASLSTEPNN